MNLVKQFYHKVQKNPNKTILVEKINNQWKEFSYANVYSRMNDCIYNLEYWPGKYIGHMNIVVYCIKSYQLMVEKMA